MILSCIQHIELAKLYEKWVISKAHRIRAYRDAEDTAYEKMFAINGKGTMQRCCSVKS